MCAATCIDDLAMMRAVSDLCSVLIYVSMNVSVHDARLAACEEEVGAGGGNCDIWIQP